MTLTKANVQGRPRTTLLSLLLEAGVLPRAYDEAANALADAFQQDMHRPGVTKEDEMRISQKWFEDKMDLLVRYGIRKEHIEQVVDTPRIAFREGALDFVDLLHERHIPLIIISATCLGVTAISHMLAKQGRLFANVHVISNGFVWDKNGTAEDYQRPVIHLFNKDSLVLANFPEVQKAVAGRSTALLLGDSLGDTKMISSFAHQHLLKVGFANDDLEVRLPTYTEAFDMLILDDGSMEPVLDLLR